MRSLTRSVQRTFTEGIERGERNITVAHVEQLADCLGINAVDLLKGDPPDGEGG